MWESSTRTLDFAYETRCCLFRFPKQESLEEKKRSYADWVDKVVEQHTGQTIEEFKAYFPLDHRFTGSIYKWILFALKKRVQVLVLNFICHDARQDPYTFPSQLLGVAGFESLKALNLSGVSLTGQVLECLLSKCQVLERLTLVHTRDLVNVRVVGSSIPLKYLVIGIGSDLKSIEIRDANLVSFSYCGLKMHKRDLLIFVFSNVPLLVEVSLLYDDFVRVNVALSQLSCCLSQLKTLRLGAQSGGLDFLLGIYELPAAVLTSLKHFELEVNGDSFYCRDSQYYTSLSQLVPLIQASLYLQRFVLKLCFTLHDNKVTDDFYSQLPVKLEKAPKWQHHCLKVVEVKGYRGRPQIVEYIIDLIENAVALEKIVIDPTQPDDWNCNHVEPKTRVEQTKKPRDHAMHHLKRMIPSTIEFVCL